MWTYDRYVDEDGDITYVVYHTDTPEAFVQVGGRRKAQRIVDYRNEVGA